MTIKFSKQEIDLLNAIISQNSPSLLSIISTIGSVPITIEQREELREALATELVQTGLEEDDEPNERGLLLERLIDLLGHIETKGG